MRFRGRAVFAATVATAAIMAPVASASASTTLPMKGLFTFSARGIGTSAHEVDVPPAGFSNGDGLVFSENIIRGGVKIGYDTVRLTFTGPNAKTKTGPKVTYSATWVLYGRGTLVASATIDDAEDGSDALVLNATRGNGQFIKVAGTVTLVPTASNVTTETFKLRLG